MGVYRCSSLAAVGLTALFSPGAHVGAQQNGSGPGCLASSDGTYLYEELLTTGLTLRWTPDTDTVAFQVVYEGQGWVGIGFSSDGNMVGADSVIGFPLDTAVLEYDLAGQSQTELIEYSDQEISLKSIYQDASVTMMTFTRPITPTVAGKESLENAVIIWAWGESNVFGFHGEDNRGSASTTIMCSTSTATVSPTLASNVTPSPTSSIAGMAPTASPAQDIIGGGGSALEPTMLPTMASMMPSVSAKMTNAPTSALTIPSSAAPTADGLRKITSSPVSPTAPSPGTGSGETSGGNVSSTVAGRWVTTAVACAAAVVLGSGMTRVG